MISWENGCASVATPDFCVALEKPVSLASVSLDLAINIYVAIKNFQNASHLHSPTESVKIANYTSSDDQHKGSPRTCGLQTTGDQQLLCQTERGSWARPEPVSKLTKAHRGPRFSSSSFLCPSFPLLSLFGCKVSCSPDWPQALAALVPTSHILN